jgi:hypothetical protein
VESSLAGRCPETGNVDVFEEPSAGHGKPPSIDETTPSKRRKVVSKMGEYDLHDLCGCFMPWRRHWAGIERKGIDNTVLFNEMVVGRKRERLSLSHIDTDHSYV